MNGNAQPLEVAMDFIKRINSGDIGSLCDLMTEGHIFQDALGKRFIGRETMRQGWMQYFKVVADYQVHADEFFQTDERIAIFGTASGRYVGPQGPSTKAGNGAPVQPSVGSTVGANGFWEVPAAWRAVVQSGKIAEWRVYADNQPLRKLMGDTTP
ncbi:MAG TPA: nuclear transport factor 2 family protein [Candidatus Sulfotelmatobacter sp.]|nr:nuclear transport factor 2 family protein [Candidatus Sulfotelmatobacter sp.]